MPEELSLGVRAEQRVQLLQQQTVHLQGVVYIH